MAKLVEITILGSGGAVPSRERLTPSILIRDWMGNQVLLDAGEAAQLRLAEAGSSPSQLDVILLTHEHGDHVNGLAGLLMTMNLQGRERPLILAGAPGALEFAVEVLEATRERLGFEVVARPMRPGDELVLHESGGDRLVARAFKACHTVEALGFRLDWILRPRLKRSALELLGERPGPWIRELIQRGEAMIGGRRISLEEVAEAGGGLGVAYTGDTAPCRSVAEAVRGVDVLLHDSTLDSGLEDEALSRGHSTAKAAALVAREAGAGLLVLIHVSQRYRGFEARRLLLEARRVFPRSILAWDLSRIVASPRRPGRGGEQQRRKLWRLGPAPP